MATRSSSKRPAAKRKAAKRPTSKGKSARREAPKRKTAKTQAKPEASAAEPRVDLVAEMVGKLIGRSVYAARDYRPLPEPGEGQTIDVCGGCEIDCCSAFTVPLNVTDAYEIRSTLRVPWEAFAELVPYQQQSPTFAVRLQGKGPAMLALKRRGRSCVFLLKLGQQRRCGMHALRPTACRLFPYLGDADAQRSPPDGMLAQRPPRDCPWCWPADETALAALQVQIDESDRRRAIDHEVLRIWHRQMDLEHTKANFFRFLEEELGRRARGETGSGRWLTRLW